jgi:hypothetical protein
MSMQAYAGIIVQPLRIDTWCMEVRVYLLPVYLWRFS